MVDWKKIRDGERKLDDAYMAFGEADFGERFGSSIEEGVAEEQRDEYRATNFPALISALEKQERRIEFLEKVLDEIVHYFEIESRTKYGGEKYLRGMLRMNENPPCENATKYLGEKNG